MRFDSGFPVLVVGHRPAAPGSSDAEDRGALSREERLEILRSIGLALPLLEAQAEIIRRVDDVLSLGEMIDRRVTVASARAEALTQSPWGTPKTGHQRGGVHRL